MRRLRIPLLFAAVAAQFFFPFNTRALVIAPTFDSSIASDPNAAKIESAINAAIQIYQTNFSDAVTVKILFKQMSSGLGQSSTYYNDVSYSSCCSALQSRASTTNDAAALAHLVSGLYNPVNGHTLIRSTLAHLRAMGFPNMNLPPGYYDSTISINFSLCNLDRANITPGKYDMMAVAMHEIDEVLGTSSALASETECRVADLFRYNSSGARSFTSSGDDAYFSLDGVNRLARYNQSSGGDYGDWWSTGPHTPQVQDAFGTAGRIIDLGVELVVLDAIGWNRIAAQSSSSTTVNPPAFQSVKRSGNQIVFTWNATAGQNYQVQYKTGVNETNWINLGAPITASGPTASSSDTIGSDPQRFYRVGWLPAGSTISPGSSTNDESFVSIHTLKKQTRQFRREEEGK
jgi:hypothetical protein